MNIEQGISICDFRREKIKFCFLSHYNKLFEILRYFQSDLLEGLVFRLSLKGAGGKKAKNQYFKQLIISLLIILFFSFSATAQDTGFPDTWGRWKTRIVLTAENLGPNALPVPEIRNGLVNEAAFFSLSGNYHFSDYDKTYCPDFKFSLPLANGRVALEVWSPFVEWFEADSLSLLERKARNLTPTGYSGGDVYVATLIQVLKNHEFLPDMLVSISLKTASGNNLEQLRHTDTPGYYFDLSLGKNFSVSEKLNVRPFGLIGFYVYQTHQVMALQNDALLWGGGVAFSTPRVDISGNVGGYRGYFNQGDRPVVARISSKVKILKNVSGTLNFQKGLNDFPFNSVSIGVKYLFFNSKANLIEND
ncbi:MAG TPA: hypothetical protein PLE67_13995 [Tenuifilaceae bacterium]|nr:hypothetical protein [Tenuifilaceae bacterium]